MFKIITLNRISEEGLKLFDKKKYEIVQAEPKDLERIVEPCAVLVRSTDMLSVAMPENVLAIARAGAGYNNIPVEKCSEMGTALFNTPGANANAVKELSLAALFLSSRDILGGFNWLKTLDGDEKSINLAVENGKSAFEGPEIAGKTLGVVGLGAIGVAVANDAAALGMNVSGFDPYISVDAAWNLKREVRRADSIAEVLSASDYISIHIPFSEETKKLFNVQNINLIKKGARLINLARGALVEEEDILAALDSGRISSYVTDFPSPRLAAHKKAICIPHLGASTPEAEVNCARMAAAALINFIEAGTIKNSVNFPDCRLAQNGKSRLLVANRNIPNMVGQITTILAAEKVNITGLLNNHKGSYAFNIIDTEQRVSAALLENLKQVDGVLRVRVIS